MASVVGYSAVPSLHNHLQRHRRIRPNGQAPLRPALLPRPPSRFARGPFPNLRVSACASTSPAVSAAVPAASFSSQAATFLSDSTRTVASLAALGLALSKLFANSARSLTAKVVSAATVAGIRELGGSLASSAGPLFFAAIRNRSQRDLNTPLTVVASGLARWLEIYSGVLMIRVLLSWFPNIPWDRQPLSAIRDLCDPYLNLFRNIIPPIFDALDVSPLLAFGVLGALSSILHSSKY